MNQNVERQLWLTWGSEKSQLEMIWDIRSELGEDATNYVPKDPADRCACTKGRKRDGSDAAFGRECMC